MPMMPHSTSRSSWPTETVTPDPTVPLGTPGARLEHAPDVNTPPPRAVLSAEALEAYMEAAAVTLGLPIDPAFRPGVLRYLDIAATMARQLDAIPLSERDEPASRFEPVAAAPRPARRDPTGAA
ncbi:DUF4089 domain-containing protein [Robbsia andropogonis]|nr:DUF4089 domain-containing protein [Robbsia andropogonis]